MEGSVAEVPGIAELKTKLRGLLSGQIEVAETNFTTQAKILPPGQAESLLKQTQAVATLENQNRPQHRPGGQRPQSGDTRRPAPPPQSDTQS